MTTLDRIGLAVTGLAIVITYLGWGSDVVAVLWAASLLGGGRGVGTAYHGVPVVPADLPGVRYRTVAGIAPAPGVPPLPPERMTAMVHIQPPDRFNGFKWVVYVEDRHGAETAREYCDDEAAARRQGEQWDDEMKRTGMTIGASSASYEH